MRHLSLLLLLASLPSTALAYQENAPATEPVTEWTVLIYGAVDNDWEQPFMGDIRNMRKGLEGTKDLEVLLLIDRSPEHSRDKQALGEDFSDTRLYRLTGGEAERLSGEPELDGLSKTSTLELNTGAAETLRDFVRFGKRKYPARHYALWLVSHGDGPQSCPDESDDDELYTAELSDVLTEQDSVDLLGFDACLMAGVENAYQWRRRPGEFGADFLLAAAPVSSSWPYEEIFERTKKPPGGTAGGLDPGTFAAQVVDELHAQIKAGRSGDRGLERDLQSWGSFDLGAVEQAKLHLDALAKQLWKDEAKQELLELRGSGLEAPTHVYVWPEHGAEQEMPNVDLTHMCERIANSEHFSKQARALAAVAAKSADLVVSSSFGMDHYKGFADGRHGLYLIFPEGDTRTRRGKTYWNSMGWYNALAVDSNGYGRYAWCLDGAEPSNGEVENWFELMDAWFDDATPDTPGGTNGYAW